MTRLYAGHALASTTRPTWRDSARALAWLIAAAAIAGEIIVASILIGD